MHVVDAALPAQRVDRTQCRLGVHRPARVVGRDRHDGAGARGDRGLDARHHRLVCRVRRDGDRPAAGDRHCHAVVEVVRLEQDHLVARVGDRKHGVGERHVAARGHDDARVVGQRDGVVGGELGRDRIEQRRDPLHGAVHVVVGIGGEACDRLERLGRRRVADHALSERDRPRVVPDQAPDHRDHRRLHHLHSEAVPHRAVPILAWAAFAVAVAGCPRPGSSAARRLGHRAETSLSPTIPATTRPMQARRAQSRGSPNRIIPSTAVPTAPMPVHTA